MINRPQPNQEHHWHIFLEEGFTDLERHTAGEDRYPSLYAAYIKVITTYFNGASITEHTREIRDKATKIVIGIEYNKLKRDGKQAKLSLLRTDTI